MIWKAIKEYPLYLISNTGLVKNKINGRILTGGYDKNGYRHVTLQTNDKQVCRRVCRLVAKAFKPNPQNLPIVNHKDENKQNDAAENLEWCTVKYNNCYGNRLQKLSKKVLCEEDNITYTSTREAERATGISHVKISDACRNNKLLNNKHWKYI